MAGGTILLAAMMAGAPSVASAGVGDFTCTAGSVTTFSPGLLLQERQQNISFNVGYGNCLSTTEPKITSGTRSGSFSGPRGCLSAPPSGTSTFTVTWNTGQTSDVTAVSGGYDVAGQTVHTLTGTVIGGLFTGSAFVEAIPQVSLNLLGCLSGPGVQSQTGLGGLLKSV
jgi:hypothetical protein